MDERNPYPSAAYMVVADDDVREWGTQDWEEKSIQYTEPNITDYEQDEELDDAA